MIFLTVGTLFPFDRLVRAIDAAAGDDLITDEIFAQIGESSYKPRNFESVPSLEKGLFDKYFTEASFVISHAGMGTIIMALSHNKPLLVMPRLKRFKEHVNNHQVGTARKFAELGHVLVAYDAADLPDCISKLKGFVPKERKANPDAVADRIIDFLNTLRD
jgi:UDP-N-acetylglucosamine transferase subunit ALG13